MRTRQNGFLDVARGLTAAMLLLVALLADAADEIESALGALQRLEYNDAAALLQNLADAGDPRAQAALATLIEAGKVDRSVYAPPLELLRAAADRGIPEAAFELGNRYFLGDGVALDFAAARRRWRDAAEQGSARAAYNLGLSYATSEHLPLDREQALTWFNQAADGGVAEAAFALGVMHLGATDAPADYAMAREQLARAAGAGSAIAQYNLGVMSENGLGADADVDSALDWYRQAAAGGVERAQEALQRLAAGSQTTDAPAGCSELSDTDWVMQQPAANYTLQVATGIGQAAIVRILQRYHAAVNCAYFALSSDANARHLALVGSFEAYLDALQYLQDLPADLKSNKPWIRRFSSVQALREP